MNEVPPRRRRVKRPSSISFSYYAGIHSSPPAHPPEPLCATDATAEKVNKVGAT